MRLHPALALAAVLLPALAAAQADEWVRDDMSDESLWLLRTANLAKEAPRSGTLPGAPDGGSHWVMSKGDGPAYVVYFIPGRIHEVEIDTHRLAGASGDFTLAVSTDGKLYQPLDAGSVLLDTSFGWDYRLMASDQIPENATHLLVQFPDGSTAHSLSEVWIRYTWDDALVSRFLPEPVAAPRQQETVATHSDAELQAMIEALMPQAEPPAAREVFPIANDTPVTIAPSEFVAEPLRTPHLVENAAPVQFATADVAESAAAPVELEEEKPQDPGDSAADAIESDPVGTESLEPQPDATAETASAAQAEADASPAIEPAEAQPEIEPLSETTVSMNEPESAQAPAEPAEGVAAIAPDSTPTDAVAVEIPIEGAKDPGASAATSETSTAIPEPAGNAATPATPDIADAGESIAALLPAENLTPADEPREAETSEEVHVLPTFTLPVMVSTESSEAPASPQFESPPPATAESVVLEPPTPAIANAVPVAPKESDSDSIESNVRATESPPAGTAVQESPVTPQDPSPTSMAVPVAPADSSQPAEITAEDEPRTKPAMKLKRTGPRSKSRGSFVTRG